ncbi:MAG: NAD(+) synthase [Opitutaceae bacterium]|nr:NAD(+) synthase [Cytophagales bacterium]
MENSKNLRLAAATVNQTPIDWTNNISNILAAIENARQEHVDLLLLPELCICGYGCEDLFFSEWVWEKSLKKLFEILPSTLGMYVSVGLPMKKEGTLYNCACFIFDGKILGFSAKQHLANDGVHYEHRWFQPWPAGKTSEITIDGEFYPFGDLVYEDAGIKIAYEICEDMWHQEARPAESYSKKGVHIILNPSASPFTFGKTKRREHIILKSTTDYNCTYLYANLLGNESGRIIFDGELFIASDGKVNAQNQRFSFKNFNLIYQDFTLTDNKLVSVQSKSLPSPETEETEFYKAASLGLFDYLRKSKSKCYVLSLSGGADSTICAVLVKTMIDLGTKELGEEIFKNKIQYAPKLPDSTPSTVNSQRSTILTTHNSQLTTELLHCAYQATENSSDNTFNSAKEVAEELGASFYNWTIDDAVSVYTSKIETAIGEKLNWKKDDISLQNIQARVRAPFIWFLANLKNGLLLTTSNRSEGDVGYCTMDGDTAGGLAPIAGVDKIFVQNWLKWAEKNLGFKSLKYVNNLQPSAELRPLETNQTDEKDLMPYSLLLQIEKLAIFERLSPERVFKTLVDNREYPKEELKNSVIKFYRLWQRNQWKRERLAPGFHLDEFNVDPKTWCRFPILGGGFEEELSEL